MKYVMSVVCILSFGGFLTGMDDAEKRVEPRVIKYERQQPVQPVVFDETFIEVLTMSTSYHEFANALIGLEHLCGWYGGGLLDQFSSDQVNMLLARLPHQRDLLVTQIQQMRQLTLVFVVLAVVNTMGSAFLIDQIIKRWPHVSFKRVTGTLALGVITSFIDTLAYHWPDQVNKYEQDVVFIDWLIAQLQKRQA